MAYENQPVVVTFPAGADLSAKQYYAMQIESDGEVNLATASTAVIGVLQNKPDAQGKASAVAVGGISKAVVNGTVAIGDRLASDANGKFATTTTNNDDYGAVALGANASGDGLIAVYVRPFSQVSNA